jgi:hypothetical protein
MADPANRACGSGRPARRRALLLALALIGGCSPKTGLQPFSSDGCSLFPDASVISGKDWCSCCFEHDIAYWRGGTEAEREAADRALEACVVAKTGDAALGRLMYAGVQAGGSPYFFSWYRWGYGWSYDRKYQALTAAELGRADALLGEYFASEPVPVCRDQASGREVPGADALPFRPDGDQRR